jgi:hypothetical protein
MDFANSKSQIPAAKSPAAMPHATLPPQTSPPQSSHHAGLLPS